MTDKKTVFKKREFWKSNVLLKKTLGITLLVLLFIVILSIVFYSSVIKNFENRILSSELSALENNVKMTENIYTDIKNMLHILGSDNDVQFCFSSEAPKNTNSDYKLGIPEKIHTLKIHNDYLNSIYIYSEAQSTFCTSEYGFTNLNDFSDRDWLYFVKNRKQPNDGIAVYPRAIGNSYPYVITFIKQMTMNGKKCVIVANADFMKLAAAAGLDGIKNFYIINGNRIIYNASMKEFGEPVSNDKILSNANLRDEKISRFYSVGHEKFVLSAMKSADYGFYYVNAMTSDKYMNGMSKNKRYFYVFLIFIFIFGAFIIYRYVKAYYEPIKSMEALIENNSVRDINYVSPELKKLSEKITRYLNSNFELKQALNESLADIERLQMQALQLQINPHFIFNVLNSVYMQSIADFGPEHNTTKMVLLFSKYMKYVLDSDYSTADVKEEIYYTKIYAELMKYRYKKLGGVIWKIDETLGEYKTLKLILQPLIENSIYHGISLKKDTESMIVVECASENNFLIFSVSDNGVGMSEEKINLITESFKNTDFLDSKHIGLKNINRRIRLAYGSGFGLEIKSKLGEGTQIKIKLPLIK